MLLLLLLLLLLLVVTRLALLVLGHDVLELRPKRLDRGELVAHGNDGLERPVELVDVGEDVLEALRRVRARRSRSA